MSSSTFALRLATEPVVDFTLERLAREGTRRALAKAIEDEVAEYIQAHRQHVDESNHRLVVRNGRHKPRTILSGVGPIEVHQPRVDDRRGRPQDLGITLAENSMFRPCVFHHAWSIRPPLTLFALRWTVDIFRRSAGQHSAN